MSEILITKLQPKYGDLFIFSIDPRITDDQISQLKKLLDNELTYEHRSKYIILPFQVGVNQLTTEQATFLASEILKKMETKP